MIYQRKLFKALKKQLPSKEIIVLTGMRRVGKYVYCKGVNY